MYGILEFFALSVLYFFTKNLLEFLVALFELIGNNCLNLTSCKLFFAKFKHNLSLLA